MLKGVTCKCPKYLHEEFDSIWTGVKGDSWLTKTCAP